MPTVPSKSSTTDPQAYARAACGAGLTYFGTDQEKGAIARRSLAEVKGLGPGPKTVAVGCAFVCNTRTRNKPSGELATVASAGAVWLLISFKVQAKKAFCKA